MSAKISVCVPIYNAEKYISECLDSLVKQTLKEIEIVCVDDGSTDDSPNILDRYAEKYKNVKVIHKENGGLGSARDAGVENAMGEYIGFMDADDVVDSKMYEKLYNLAVNNNAEIAFCNLDLFPKNVKTNKRIWYNPYEDELTGEFLYRNTQPWNKIFSRKLFERVNYKFGKNDSLCILLMLKSKGILSTDEKLYHYRVGHDSMSRAFKMNELMDTVDSMMEIRKFVREYDALENKLGEYFDFLVEDSVIKVLAVSASRGECETYNKYKKMLSEYSYRRNKYIQEFLRREHGALKYFAIVYVLPRNFALSKILLKGKF